jgi:hypothetical protein
MASSSNSTQEFNGAHKGWKAYPHKKVLEEMVHMELKSKKKLQAGTLLTVIHRHLEADSEPLRIAEQIQDIPSMMQACLSKHVLGCMSGQNSPLKSVSSSQYTRQHWGSKLSHR